MLELGLRNFNRHVVHTKIASFIFSVMTRIIDLDGWGAFIYSSMNLIRKAGLLEQKIRKTQQTKEYLINIIVE